MPRDAMVCLISQSIIAGMTEPEVPAARHIDAGAETDAAGPGTEKSAKLTAKGEQRPESKRLDRWLLILTVFFGFVALGLGAIGVHYAIKHSLTVAGTWIGIGLVLGSLGFTTDALYRQDKKSEGTQIRKPQKPPTRMRSALRAFGWWTLMLPFSGISVFAAGLAIYSFTTGSWSSGGVTLAISIFFGAMGALLVAGSAVVAESGTDLTPGEPVRADVRRSRWWRHVRLVLFVWCAFTTAGAITYAIQGNWGNFLDIGSIAVASWASLWAASTGRMPKNPFGSSG